MTIVDRYSPIQGTGYFRAQSFVVNTCMEYTLLERSSFLATIKDQVTTDGGPKGLHRPCISPGLDRTHHSWLPRSILFWVSLQLFFLLT
jgi:hypothetical protein